MAEGGCQDQMRKDALKRHAAVTQVRRCCAPGVLASASPRRTGRAGRHRLERREEARRSPPSPGQAARQSLTSPARSGGAFPGDRAERRHSPGSALRPPPPSRPGCAADPGPQAAGARAPPREVRAGRGGGDRGGGGEPRRSSGGPRAQGSSHPGRGEGKRWRRDGPGLCPRPPGAARQLLFGSPGGARARAPMGARASPEPGSPARPPSVFFFPPIAFILTL